MIFGYFDSEGAPYLDGWVVIERLGVQGLVRFLVDTGADSGALHSADGKILGCRFGLLHDEDVRSFGGVGGSQDYFPEDATIFFEGVDGIYAFDVSLDIAKPSEETDDLPSLLGRDLLNSLRIEYAYTEGVLRFDLSA